MSGNMPPLPWIPMTQVISNKKTTYLYIYIYLLNTGIYIYIANIGWKNMVPTKPSPKKKGEVPEKTPPLGMPCMESNDMQGETPQGDHPPFMGL